MHKMAVGISISGGARQKKLGHKNWDVWKEGELAGWKLLTRSHYRGVKTTYRDQLMESVCNDKYVRNFIVLISLINDKAFTGKCRNKRSQLSRD